ncbi:hypothetical protein [Candidatus Ichthyocystis sparus]|uniref:hypothetical protein n=1 Tax=Candidatus Ichthyocystis sparus TaxID=1561004 RepID=UPI000B85FCE1|nr:hypothetical protein [Candidatus Ichthyocystis sparus]
MNNINNRPTVIRHTEGKKSSTEDNSGSSGAISSGSGPNPTLKVRRVALGGNASSNASSGHRGVIVKTHHARSLVSDPGSYPAPKLKRVEHDHTYARPGVSDMQEGSVGGLKRKGAMRHHGSSSGASVLEAANQVSTGYDTADGSRAAGGTKKPVKGILKNEPHVFRKKHAAVFLDKVDDFLGRKNRSNGAKKKVAISNIHQVHTYDRHLDPDDVGYAYDEIDNKYARYINDPDRQDDSDFE